MPDGLVKLVSMERRWTAESDQDGPAGAQRAGDWRARPGAARQPDAENALAAAFGAREKAVEAQQAAMAALNLPSAGDVERLERRLRSFSQRLEEVEDQVEEIAATSADAPRTRPDRPKEATPKSRV